MKKGVKRKARKKWDIGKMWKNGMPLSIRKKISERARERYKTRAIWNKNRKWTKGERRHISEGKKRAFRQKPELLKKIIIPTVLFPLVILFSKLFNEPSILFISFNDS